MVNFLLTLCLFYYIFHLERRDIMNLDEAIKVCKSAFNASYAPYSNYHVGAALVCKSR